MSLEPDPIFAVDLGQSVRLYNFTLSEDHRGWRQVVASA